MRLRSTLVTAVLAGTLALGACGDPASEEASGDAGPAEGPSDERTSEPANTGPGTEIPDDFPLSAGMGGPQDTLATSRTGTGLRDLTLCDTAPLRGLGTRDRMIADNSGGESANTRELVLLGSPDEAARVARAFTDLPSGCPDATVTADMETLTEVRQSRFGPAPAVTLVQTYTFDGEPGTGATVIHVIPAGAALLITSTYGQWTGAALEQGVAETVDAVRETVTGLDLFDAGTPSSGASAARSSGSPVSVRPRVSTYGEGSLASLDEQADTVTGTTGKIVPAMRVFTKTGS